MSERERIYPVLLFLFLGPLRPRAMLLIVADTSAEASQDFGEGG